MRSTLTRMCERLSHRGPDASGSWIDDRLGVALGHRRLSIIDLSHQGAQPMASPCGRYVIVFNGEIYNFQALRLTLEKEGGAPSWRGHSDTEVMLAAVSHWGIEKAVKALVGMFAFALWDIREQRLFLARDRIGEKPLYYGWTEKAFLFGSELKALMAHERWRGEIDRNALTLFLRYNYIPAPFSIFKRIFKVLPGTILSIKVGDTSPPVDYSKPLAPVTYWSLRDVAAQGSANPFKGDEQDAVSELDRLLREAVRRQMVADVPLGAFLSGGIDSSTIVALMQAQSSRPVRTFTIGFQESDYNEAEHARAVALHLGTQHTEMTATPEDALAVIPRLPALYDEPFADASQIPTFLVAEMTRQHVTVSLSGDAGDELFGGYNRYLLTENIWRKCGWMPSSLRTAIGGAVMSLPSSWLDRGFGWLAPQANRYGRKGQMHDKLHKFFSLWSADSPESLYLSLTSCWKEPASVVLNACEPGILMTNPEVWPALPTMFEKMMFLDQTGYLPEDILVKVDRAAMGVSLETRIPLLDHGIVEFAWRIPLSMKLRNGKGKWLLRQVLDSYVPREIMERPKRGFAIPVEAWLRGPLQDWAEVLLDENRLRREGFFRPEPVRKIWHEHLAGQHNWSYRLWGLLMFQAWLEHLPVQVI